MLQNLNNAQWQHSKKKAKLIEGSTILVEIEFSRKAASVKIGKQKFEISKDGFGRPRIRITEKDKVIALQKQLGLWGTKSEFILEDQNYIAKTRQGKLFNITYSNSNNDILSYRLDTLKNKPKITFEIMSFDISEKHLLLLLALGFYSIKNLAVEAMANDFIVTAVA